MLLLAVAFGGIALLLALRAGGSLDRLAATQFSWTGVLPVALALQLIASFWPGDWVQRYGLWLVLVANALVAVFFLANRSIPGLWITALGMVLNVLVIGLNAGMPVSPRAIEIAGAPELTPEAEHVRLDDSTVLPWFADVIPIPGVGTVVSAGDVVLALGVGVLIYKQTKGAGQAT